MDIEPNEDRIDLGPALTERGELCFDVGIDPTLSEICEAVRNVASKSLPLLAHLSFSDGEVIEHRSYRFAYSEAEVAKVKSSFLDYLRESPDTGEVKRGTSPPQKLILENRLSPGDIVVMTTAIRELQRQHPRRYVIDVRTSCDAIFEGNPDVTRLPDGDANVRRIRMEYPLVHQSNSRPVHFIQGYCDFLAGQLRLPSLNPQEFRPHIWLRPEEKSWMSQIQEITGEPNRFWIVNSGGKSDFTNKVWPQDSFQGVVDHFRDRITFVQTGQADHNHPALDGVIDLRGKTDARQLIRLVYHASGVLTGVSFPMHLAAAVERPPWVPGIRPCVVIAGGREPPHWEAYPGHQFLHTIGALDCCAHGGCWKSRVVPLRDGRQEDRSLCQYPEDGAPRCMRMITPEAVIRAIELYGPTAGIRPAAGEVEA